MVCKVCAYSAKGGFAKPSGGPNLTPPPAPLSFASKAKERGRGGRFYAVLRLPMNLQELSERYICSKIITQTVLKAGWGESQIETESHYPDLLLEKYKSLLSEIEVTENELKTELASALSHHF
ncbi:MAG TPA: hypothetical protein PK683_20895 [Leptospiraceae bacterium]|nr:hypothetical protein [Leptospiraceae bacterium]